MERLTKRLGVGQAVMHCDGCKGKWAEKHGKPMGGCTALYCRNMCKDRLAAYEDTGLTPEEIDMDHEAAEQLRDLCQGYDLDRLDELAKADREGRVVVLPCNVGDTVYVLYGEGYRPCVVDRIHVLSKNEVQIRARYPTTETLSMSASDFSKTVFLTREEAEEALRRDGNGDC